MEPATKRRRLSPPQGNGQSLPGFAKFDLEQDYEQRRRKNQKKESNKLFIKSQNHDRWEQQSEDDQRGGEVQNEQDSFLGSDDEEGKDVAQPQPVSLPPKPRLPPKEEVRQAKEELARTAGLVSENPEEHIAMLGSLAQFAGSSNTTVKKLALGTQLAVYRDIIPGYRIRPLTKNDTQGKLSKDVRKLRNFEQSLLGGYKEYVETLSKISKGEADTGLASVAIACVCSLLTSAPHFNLRNDLIGILVQRLSSRNVDADFTKCRETLEQLFEDDEEGHASLEAVNQLTKMMKAKNYNIDESVLNTFLHLRLLSEFAHKASTNQVDKDDPQYGKFEKKSRPKKEFRTKRERKLLRERKEVEKEMKEADAVVSYEERDKNQAETLKLVFVAYFRILKARTQRLMGAVLEGLAKYAHLINQDFFGDILEALKDIINDAIADLEDEDRDEQNDGEEDERTRNATRESLLCVITAFALLQGQQDVAKSANSLHLDLNFFITHLYRSILPLTMDSELELRAKSAHLADPNGLSIPTAKDTKVNVATTTVLLLRSLQAVLFPPTATKMVSPVRIAAFTKQLLSASLHLPQKSVVAVLGLLQQVSKVHAQKIAALWNTEERKGDGVFDPLSQEVESSNPFASTAWEGELLRLHFDPRIRDSVEGIERNVLEAR